MRRVHQCAHRTCVGCPLGFLGGDLGSFTGDAGNDRDLVTDSLDQGLNERGLFVGRQERAFAGVAQTDQAFDSFNGDQPLGQLRVRFMVDASVFGENGDGCGVESSKIHDVHRYLSYVKV